MLETFIICNHCKRREQQPPFYFDPPWGSIKIEVWVKDENSKDGKRHLDFKTADVCSDCLNELYEWTGL